MADMEHLFREQEMREQAEATGRPTANGIFKTALYRAEKAQYNMRMKIGKAEAEEVVIYAESVPRSLKEGYGLHVLPEKQSASTTNIDAHRDVCVTWKDTGGTEIMIKKFCKWMSSPEDLPRLVARMLTAILITAVWAFLLALIAALTMCRLQWDRN